MHGFFIFPKTADFLSKILNKKFIKNLKYEPSVSLFIPAYNEEKVIAEKIANALSLDYPREKLEILVCSDCSNDQTPEIVKELAKKHSQIKFNNYKERSGKIGMINKAIPYATGEVIVMTDANTMFERNAIRELVSGFSRESISAVLGDVRFYVPDNGVGLSKEVTYHNFEASLKTKEGLFGCAMGAFGGLYAFKKTHFNSLPKNAMCDDFLISVGFIEQGHEVVFNKDAIANEETGNSIKEEFQRRIRIGAGNFQLFKLLPKMLNPFKFIRFYFYISHKVTRWFLPFILILILFSNILLAISGFLYSTLLLLQVFIYSASLFGWVLDRMGKQVAILTSSYHFVAMNIAILIGFFKFLKGIKVATWESTSRS